MSPAADPPARTATRPRGGRSRQRDAERPPLALADARRRLWTSLDPEFPFTPHFVRSGDHWLHFVDEGPPNGEVLLFLHGNPTWSFLWRRLLARFRDRYRVVAPDYLGCGLSEKPANGDYTLAGHAERVRFLVEELDLERVTLVTHDWGGAIGMGLARRVPERVARFVFCNTAAFPFPVLPRRIAVCRTPLLGPLLVRGLGGFSRAALRTAHAKRGRFSKQERRGYLAPYASWADRVAIQAFVDDIPMDPKHRSWSELTAIADALDGFRDRPAACLWGMRDWCFTPAILDEWLRRWPELEVTRFPEAGHWVTEDEPDGVGEALEAFLARHPLSSESPQP